MLKIWILGILLCLTLICTTAAFTGCGDNNNTETEAPTSAATEIATEAATQPQENTQPAETTVKNGIIGSEEEGYYYAGENGEIDYGYCDGVTVDGEDWVVCEGHAYKVYTDAGRTWFYAAQAIGKCTESSMSREEKLRAAFDYIKTSYLEGVPHDPPYRELDWPVVCANDLFVYGKGDCFSYGAAFAYMAKAIGYEDVYACNSGGHGWAEIEGKYYDPEWDMHHNEYNHFGVAPGDECDVKYAASLMDGVEWMRMAV